MHRLDLTYSFVQDEQTRHMNYKTNPANSKMKEKVKAYFRQVNNFEINVI